MTTKQEKTSFKQLTKKQVSSFNNFYVQSTNYF